MSKVICCTFCDQKIEEKDDLITSIYSLLFRIKPFHNECYGKAMRGKELFIMGRIPVNSTGFVVLCIIALIAMTWFLFESFYFLAAIMLIPVVLRIASWIIYERKYHK